MLLWRRYVSPRPRNGTLVNMKTLLLARHAEADPAALDMTDHDRPLNDRGVRAAHAMAQRLLDEGIRVQQVVASPAIRARGTADAYASAFDLPVIENTALYVAWDSPSGILTAASSLNDDLDVVLLVGHAPGMASAVTRLTDSLVELPTGAVAECSVEVDSWGELVNGSARLARLFLPGR